MQKTKYTNNTITQTMQKQSIKFVSCDKKSNIKGSIVRSEARVLSFEREYKEYGDKVV